MRDALTHDYDPGASGGLAGPRTVLAGVRRRRRLVLDRRTSRGRADAGGARTPQRSAHVFAARRRSRCLAFAAGHARRHRHRRVVARVRRGRQYRALLDPQQPRLQVAARARTRAPRPDRRRAVDESDLGADPRSAGPVVRRRVRLEQHALRPVDARRERVRVRRVRERRVLRRPRRQGAHRPHVHEGGRRTRRRPGWPRGGDRLRLLAKALRRRGGRDRQDGHTAAQALHDHRRPAAAIHRTGDRLVRRRHHSGVSHRRSARRPPACSTSDRPGGSTSWRASNRARPWSRRRKCSAAFSPPSRTPPCRSTGRRTTKTTS